MKIVIDGVIGWDVLASDVREKLKEANGEDLDLEISSPGGSVFEGLTIFRLLAKYKNDHDAKITAEIISLAASMASYIPLVADEITVYNTSVFMIHNAWGLAIGNAEKIRKTADILDRLSGIILSEYVRKTGRSEDELKQQMDAETFLYGQEIIDAGFADKMEEDSTGEKQKDEEIELALMTIQDAQEKFTAEQKNDDLQKAVALLEPKQDIKIGPLFGTQKAEIKKPLSGAKNKKEEDFNIMTLNEILDKYPEAKVDLADQLKAEAKRVRDEALEIVAISGVTLSESAMEAISTGGGVGEYAKAELKARNEKTAEVPEEQNSDFGGFEPKKGPEAVADGKTKADIANEKAMEEEKKNLRGGM